MGKATIHFFSFFGKSDFISPRCMIRFTWMLVSYQLNTVHTIGRDGSPSRTVALAPLIEIHVVNEVIGG